MGVVDMRTATVAHVMTIATAVLQDTAVAMTMALGASIVMHHRQGEKSAMVVGRSTVAETIHQEIAPVAMEMHLQEMPMEVETETILQTIGTPVVEPAC